jgi:hypothetical protein
VRPEDPARVIFVALLLLSSGVLLAQPASPDDGPAARQFASWLALLNEGDRAALEAYHRLPLRSQRL